METAVREQWLALRREGIGGSDIAAILGISHFRTSLDVYMEKTMGVSTPDSPYLRIGRLIEPTIAVLFEEATNLKTTILPEGSLFRSKTDPLKMCTPDRLIEGEHAGLEMKNVDRSKASEWGPTMSQEIPIDAFCQAHWCMDVLEYPVWYVAALIGGNDFRFYRFEQDPSLCEQMTAAAHAFKRNHLDPLIPPAGSPEVLKTYLSHRYPANTKDLLPTTDEALAIARDIREAETQAEAFLRRVEEGKNALREMIGAHDGIESVATWKKAKDSLVVDWKAVAQTFSPAPELIAKHTQTRAGARTFLLKYKGE